MSLDTKSQEPFLHIAPLTLGLSVFVSDYMSISQNSQCQSRFVTPFQQIVPGKLSVQRCHISYKSFPKMNLKSLKHAIGSALPVRIKSKTMEKIQNKIPEASSIDRYTEVQLQNAVDSKCDFKTIGNREWPLASACDVVIFPLLDLPTELVKAVIFELVKGLTLYRTCKLRTVNSKHQARTGAFATLT